MEKESFSFDGVEAASGSMTMPGTVGVFTIQKVEFVKSKEKQTTGMKHVYHCTKARGEDGKLVPEDSNFNHTYWMSQGALPRVQYLAKVMFDKEFEGQIGETQLIAAFEGKEVAMKVIGQVNEEKGKGYPDLPFAGFAKKASEFVADPSILQFNASERGLISDALDAIKSSRPAAADSEGGAAGPGPAPGTSKKPF